jgi:uncharacterized protein
MAEQPVPSSSPEVTSDDRLWGMLCFLLEPLVPIIVLLMEDKKSRPFIKFHAVPALILGIALAIIAGILAVIPIVQCFAPLVWIIPIIYAVKAYKGEYVKIPIITDFAKNQGWI